MAIRYLSGINVDNNVLFVDDANNRVGIGTGSPSYRLHISGGSEYIEGGFGQNTNSPYTSANRLIFSSEYSDIARGPNKITLYDASWLGGFGVHENTLAYYSGGNHNWYQASNATNATSLMTLLSNGNLGIGTTSPGERLELAGSNVMLKINASTDTFAQLGYYENGTLKWNAYNNYANDNYQVGNSGGTYFAITPSGNVGIGTTSPSALLHVSGTNTSVLSSIVENTSSASGAYAGYRIQSDYGHTYLPGLLLNSSTNTGYAGVDQLMLYQYHSKPISLVTNNIVRLMVSGAGDVGIGTTSPVSKLNIDNGDAWINVTDTLRGLQFGYAGPSHGSYRAAVMGGAESYGGTDSGMLTFHTQNGYVVSAIPPERMRITSAGNVGIGTTSPAAKLQLGNGTSNSPSSVAVLSADGGNAVLNALSLVNSRSAANGNGTSINFHNANNYGPTGRISSVQDSGTNASLRFSVYNSTDDALIERITLLSSGNVGIGTTNPYEALDVVGNIRIGNYTTAGTQYIGYANNTFGNQFIAGMSIESTTLGGNYSQKLNFATHYYGVSAGVRMTIDEAGAVGIGTTTPSHKLDVEGNIRAKSATFYIGTTSTNYLASNNTDVYLRTNAIHYFEGNNFFKGVWDASGNLGIGTTAPSHKLDVNGNQAVRGTTDYIGTLNGTAISIDHPGVQTWRIGINNSNTSTFSIGNDVSGTFATKVLNITNTGNVGIGTTSPSYKLSVATSGALGFSLNTGTAGVGNPQIDLYDAGRAQETVISSTDGTTVGTYIASYSNHPILFGTYAGSTPTAKMAITAAGNVGIGTTSPITKLTVGSYSGSRLPYINGTANTFDANGITVTSSNTANAAIGGGIDLTNNVHSVGSFSPLISFSALSQSGTYNNNYAAIYGVLAGDSGDGNWNSGHLVFATALAYGASEKMRITNAGNVGIGTTAPGQKLDVIGQAAIGSSAQAIVGSDGTYGGYSTIGFGGISNGYNRVFGYNGTADGLYLTAATGQGIAFRTNGGSTDNMFIADNGNVGIGTTAPYGKLELNGNGDSWTTAPAIRMWDSFNSKGWLVGNVNNITAGDFYIRTLPSVSGSPGSGQQEFTIKHATGNVGIGTTAPGSKLQVEGANPFIRVNNTSADDHGIKISYNGSDAHGLHLLYNANSAVSYIDNTYQAVSGQVYGNIYIRQNVGGTMTSRITIKADGGNVGIGTTSPSQALDVNGYITSSRYYPYNSNSTYISGDTGGLVIQGSGYLYVPASGGSYFEGAVRFRGYIYNDSATYLTINGGTSNVTYFTGNVGIGTTSPSEKLHVDGNVIVTYNNSFQGINSIGNKAILARVSPTTGIINYAEYATATNLNGFVMGSDDARVKGNIATDSLEFITNTSTRMTILSNGDVGINNTNPSRKLDVTGEARVVSTSNLAMFIKTSSGFGAGISYEDSTTGGNDVVYAGAIGAAFFIATGAAERVRVLSGGNVGIATNNPLSRLHVVGDARIASGSLGVGVAPNATDGRVDASNDIVAYSTSDQRLKENVMPIENALEKVKTLTGVEFDWKEKTAHVHGYHGHDVGIIAQDVQAVLPEAVRTNESGYLSVRYEKMIALLIEANKELAARVEELEKKLK